LGLVLRKKGGVRSVSGYPGATPKKCIHRVKERAGGGQWGTEKKNWYKKLAACLEGEGWFTAFYLERKKGIKRREMGVRGPEGPGEVPIGREVSVDPRGGPGVGERATPIKKKSKRNQFL